MKRIEVQKWDKYEMLTIIKEIEPDRLHWHNFRMFECLCECWKTTQYRLNTLRHMNIKSCWCYAKTRFNNNLK